MNKGDWNGRKKKEINWRDRGGDYWYKKTPNGESFAEGFERTKEFYDEIVKKYSKETILIVGHGGTIRYFIKAITNKSLKEVAEMPNPKNTSLWEYEIKPDGSYKETTFNYPNHL